MVGDIACKMVRHLGYEAVHVKEGRAAVDEYTRRLESAEPFDAVIMDLTVPDGGMGGTEAVVALLAVDPDARVLVSSGYSTDPIMTNYRQHGFVGVVKKPFDLASIKSILDSLCS